MSESPPQKSRNPAISIVVVTALAFGLIYGTSRYANRPAPKRISGSRAAPRPLSAENPPSPESFDPFRAASEFPAITEFKTVSAREIADSIDDVELVIGVVIDGEPRAYPINMMTGPNREIFNDVLAGQPIAATW